MQKQTFPDGGYVLHAIVLGEYKGKFSAWFSADGKIHDAQQVIGSRERPVKHNGRAWKQLQSYGRIYGNVPPRAINPKPRASLKEISASSLKARLEASHRRHMKIIDEMIAAGRGHERSDETRSKTDPLSQRFNAELRTWRELFDEKQYRTKYHGKLSPVKRQENPSLHSPEI